MRETDLLHIDHRMHTASPTDVPLRMLTMAQRIVAYRDKNGPFKKLEDLMNIQGIGEKSFLKLRPLLTIGGQGDAKASKN